MERSPGMTPSELYEKALPIVEKLASKEDEDTRQELWARLFQKAGYLSYDDLYIVVVRQLIDLKRTVGRSVKGDREVEETDRVVEPVTEGVVIPEAKPQTREQYEVVARMVAEGYTYQEIGKKLRVSYNRVYFLMGEIRNDGERVRWTPPVREAA